MALSLSPWYEGYAAIGTQGFAPGGLTAAEDQQLAGLIMWIPGGLVHFIAAGVFAYGALKQVQARLDQAIRTACKQTKFPISSPVPQTATAFHWKFLK